MEWMWILFWIAVVIAGTLGGIYAAILLIARKCITLAEKQLEADRFEALDGLPPAVFVHSRDRDTAEPDSIHLPLPNETERGSK